MCISEFFKILQIEIVICVEGIALLKTFLVILILILHFPWKHLLLEACV